MTPKSNGTFNKDVVYTHTMNGVSLKDQRDLLRELIHIRFPNTEKLVIDKQSAGQGLLSILEEPWSYRKKGQLLEFPALICDDDEDTARLLPDAVPMIRGIAATKEFNIMFYPYMKSCFEDQSLRLLIDSNQTDGDYRAGEYSADEQLIHVEHDNLIQELSNIKQTFTTSGSVTYEKIVKTIKRDRATSLMYGLSVVFEMEKQGKADAFRKEEDTLEFLTRFIY